MVAVFLTYPMQTLHASYYVMSTTNVLLHGSFETPHWPNRTSSAAVNRCHNLCLPRSVLYLLVNYSN